MSADRPHPHHGIQQQAVVELDGVLTHVQLLQHLVHHLRGAWPRRLCWYDMAVPPSLCHECPPHLGCTCLWQRQHTCA